MRLGGTRRALLGLAALALAASIVLGSGLSDRARAERTQHGNLILSLDGEMTPLKLPRDRLAPIAVHLVGGLRTSDGAPLPRATRVELGLPGQGVLSTQGLPACSQWRLRNTKSGEALAACGPALVGSGRLDAEVVLPHQAPFEVHARLLAFNARDRDGRRMVLLHAYAAQPPTAVVLLFHVRPGSGRFGLALVADLAPALGPWPRFARFELTLARRFSYRGRSQSYLSASCPLPPRFTAGFFSFARASFRLADGGELSTGIARGCRAR